MRANSKAFFHLFDLAEDKPTANPEAQEDEPPELTEADEPQNEVDSANYEVPLPAPASSPTTPSPFTAPILAEVIRYACKACRAVLVTNDEVQKHLPPAGSARGDELCQQLFIKAAAHWVKMHEKVISQTQFVSFQVY